MRRTARAQDVADNLGFDPVEWLIKIAVDGVMLNPDGTETPVDTDQRLDAGKAVMPYLKPKLLAATVTQEEPPDTRTTIDIERMMQDPALVEAAQRLSLAANHAPMLPAPEPEIPLEVITDDDDGSGDD